MNWHEGNKRSSSGMHHDGHTSCYCTCQRRENTLFRGFIFLGSPVNCKNCENWLPLKISGYTVYPFEIQAFPNNTEECEIYMYIVHTFLFSRFRTFLSMMATAVWTGSEPSGNTGPPSPAAFCTDEFFFGGIIIYIYTTVLSYSHWLFCVWIHNVKRKHHCTEQIPSHAVQQIATWPVSQRSE